MVLDEIKTTDIENFKAKELKRNISTKTINNRLAILRKCLVTAIDWEELERLPKIKLLKTTPSKFRFLREEELQAILAACETPDDRALVLIGARTGLRFSELRALEWGDIDFDHRLLTVRRCAVLHDIGTPKNGRIRHVPLTDEVMGTLWGMKRLRGLVFPYQGRMRVHWTSLLHLQAACKRASIEPIGWHTLRHTFASHLISKGASIKAVQDLLGHSTITMTQRYAHLAPETLHDTIALLQPISNSMSAQRQPEVKKNSVEVEKLLLNLFNSSPRIEKN
jgi:integrase